MVRRSKVLVVLAVLALILVAAVPAIAQVTQSPAETFVSGSNANNAGSVTTGGNSSSTCSVQQGFNNSGGILNQQGQQQYATKSNGGGNLFEGSTFNNTPAQTAPCEPTVQQAASASSSVPQYAVPLQYSVPQ